MNNKQKTIESYNKTVDKYIEKVDKFPPRAEHARFADLLQGKEVLDLGCGPGRDANFLAQAGLSVLGVDLSEKMIEAARGRVKKARFEAMDICNLKFGEKEFDGVWASACLLHVPKEELDKVLKDLHTILKKGGVLYASVKKGEGEVLKPDERYGGVEKFWSFFDKEEIENRIVGAGFEILDSYIEVQKNSYATNPWIHVFAKK